MSPGGYEFRKDEKPFKFDFAESYCFLDDKDPKTVHFCAEKFDDDYAAENGIENKFKNYKDIANYHYTDFFIYMNENLTYTSIKEILTLMYYFYDEKNNKFVSIGASENQLREITEIIQENQKEK